MQSFLSKSDNCLDSCLLGPAGRIIWLNRSAQDILNIALKRCRGELLGRFLRDPQLMTFWQEATRNGDTAFGEVSIRWPKHAELKCNCTPCLDSNGEMIGRALLFCDVTHERSIQVELSRQMADRLLQLTNDGHPDRAGDPAAGLTPQEINVMRLVGKGLRNQDIADQVSISPSTVRTHLKSIYRKLGLASRAEAVRYAVENQLF
jgi:DNA-binding CsgD family transcriptional regulator